MDVEMLAVSTITSLFGKCPHLRASISANDKTPFTDGHIDLHSTTEPSKANWVGRTPVQVKGRSRSAKKPLANFKVDRTELAAFEQENGVLYLVVTVHPDSGATCAYYSILSPFALESMLRESNATRLPIRLTPLPNDTEKLERIVGLAITARAEQPSHGFDPIVLEHLEGFTVHTLDELDLSAPVTLQTGVDDFALVLHTDGGFSLPAGGVLQLFPPDYLPRRVEFAVRSGPSTYQTAEVRRTSETTFEARLSAGLVLRLRRETDDRVTIDVSFHLADTLGTRLRDLDFFTSLIDTQVLHVGDHTVPYRLNAADDDPRLRKHLLSLRALDTLMTHLDVNSELIDLTALGETEFRQLRTIYRGCVEGQEVDHETTTASRALQTLGRWHLLLFVTPGTTPGKWRLLDPFAPQARGQFRLRTGTVEDPEAIPITAYELIDDEHVATVLNSRLSSIVDAYEAIGDAPSTSQLANQRVLVLLSAADSAVDGAADGAPVGAAVGGESRGAELLTAADELNEWLIRREGEQPHHLINRWQIRARRGTLSAEDRAEVRALRRTMARADGDGAENAGLFELACAVLLGDRDEVEDLMAEISADPLEQFRGWPIWALYEPGTKTGQGAAS